MKSIGLNEFVKRINSVQTLSGSVKSWAKFRWEMNNDTYDVLHNEAMLTEENDTSSVYTTDRDGLSVASSHLERGSHQEKIQSEIKRASYIRFAETLTSLLLQALAVIVFFAVYLLITRLGIARIVNEDALTSPVLPGNSFS